VDRILSETRSGSYDVSVTKNGVNILAAQVKNVDARHGTYLLQSWREATAAAPKEAVPVGLVKVSSSPKSKQRDTWLAVVDLTNFAAAIQYALDSDGP
jgi:hypothetical protein